jgi:pyrroline-5-carboxylate reductase
MKIAIIGAGNLGQSIAHGILNQKKLKYSSLYLTKRNTKALKKWEEVQNLTITTDNIEAVRQSEVIIIAVQPGHLSDVLEEIKAVFNPAVHTLISVVTGRKIQQIEAVVGSEISIIRGMPNTAIAVSQSMTCLSANKPGEKGLDTAKQIFDTLGAVICIDEDLMQAATVICASGIAFWMRLIRATTQGAIQLGFEAEIAKKIAIQTCKGAASLLIETGNHPEQEIDKVTTPNGCTIEGLNEMEHQGLSSSLIKGIVTSFNKINQI